MSEMDLYTIYVNQTLSGMYPSIKHSDRKVFPAYILEDSNKVKQQFVDVTGNNPTNHPFEYAVEKYMLPYLEDEINRSRALIDKGIGKDIMYYNKNAGKGTIMADIVGQDVYNSILEGNTMIDSSTVKNRIIEFFKNVSARTETEMSRYKLLEDYHGRKAIGISANMVTKYGSVKSCIDFATVNSVISHIEEAKLLSGNLALYKDTVDISKRMNSQSSSKNAACIS